jgi:hypothetical protein
MSRDTELIALINLIYEAALDSDREMAFREPLLRIAFRLPLGDSVGDYWRPLY